MSDVRKMINTRPGDLQSLIEAKRIILIRGSASADDESLLALGAALGIVVEQPLGRIVDIIDKGDHASFLFSRGSVPLHWDGALGAVTPRFVFLACAMAPSRSGEGATTFIDTVAAWRSLPEAVREEWRSLNMVYRAPGLHHPLIYPLVTRHPHSREEVIRIVAPRRRDTIGEGGLEVDIADRSPADAQLSISSIVARLEQSAARYDHHWRTGDIVIVDNFAVLHGRGASAPGSRRLLRRMHVG